ncbi:DNA-deoxyinosine glycosylase [Flavobacterium magnum]|uniref:DNA-deoxyinosine glycosylase n=1 Tax=Flavobacterium magnum TaxID=2162713 RepID=A0A2S0RJY6_9FLAO|nr:DNA-deoxyinosine glycosylase [Flavobacterium magnum]AWA31518.1 DNA-deoxyinosine glycosylase [Flavobacterium magnum]
MISSFPPFIDSNTKILILGTMPGATSLAKQEYYAHRQNHFWRIFFTYFDRLPVPDAFEERIRLLQQNNIGVWDVLQHCEREGSLDTNIRNHQVNDFGSLFAAFPNIRHVLFNGKESHRYFMKHIGALEGIKLHVMPSTSPANTMAFDKKFEIWSQTLKDTAL